MKKVISLVLTIMVLCLMTVPAYAEITVPGGSESVVVELTAVASRFSVVVPTVLTIDVDENGIVTTATNAKIINQGHGSVVVASVDITGENGWSVVDFTTDMTKEKVGLQKIGFEINNCATDNLGDISINSTDFPSLDGNNISDSDELVINYDAIIPAQKTAITDEVVASVVFILAWNE